MNGKFIFGLFVSTLMIQVAVPQNLPKVKKSYEPSAKRGGNQMWLDTLWLSGSPPTVAVNLTLAAPGCSGHIAGVGTIEQGVLQVRQYGAVDEEDKACVVTIKFDGSGKTAQLSEQSCTSFHGASCQFVGRVVAKPE